MALTSHYLTPEQHSIVEFPVDSHIFLEGPAGRGKTTVGVERLVHLLQNGIPGNQILLLIPQRTLGAPYANFLTSPGNPAGTAVNILTIGGLARRMVDLFWPVISNQAGFAQPDRMPTFLTLESAQYYMAYLVRPLLAEGYFDSVTIDRNRLFSQIIDNLNKAAAVGISHKEVSQRLKTAWVGETSQVRVYDDTQHCVNLFREFCLSHNLLDFSLQLELFWRYLWPEPICQDHLRTTYHHLIFDNIEEDIPLTTDLLHEWIGEFDSTLLIYDQDAGYRQFLSADPSAAYTLKGRCEHQIELTQTFVSSQEITAFGSTLASALSLSTRDQEIEIHESPIHHLPIHYTPLETRFYPEMLDWVAAEIAGLVHAGTPPGQIVVLSPYLSDSLRYSLVARLNQYNIPSRSHRPSRALREEPAVRCLLTLASLAHPSWGLYPQKSDLTYALMQAIDGLDLIRAQLLVDCAYRKGIISSFDRVKPNIQDRITFQIGNRFEALQEWINEYAIKDQSQELDFFLNRLFGEVLSQPGFGFHVDYNAAAAAANLIESVRKFRWAVGDVLEAENIPIGREYIMMVRDGVIAAQYLGSWASQPEDAVYLAPAYTFLMSNRPVDVQFWLDVGSRGWHERLYQPLTQPYVLSRHWVPGSPWTDSDELEANRAALTRLALGLTRRCRTAIYLGLSSVNEQGYEHKGDLLRGIDRALLALTPD